MNITPLSYPFHFTGLELPGRQVVAIGDFDGVHLGHQEVIRRAVDTARQSGMQSSIMTFSPHPREILGKSAYRQILTPLGERLEMFRGLGIDRTYVVAFNVPFSQLSPEAFVNELLVPLGMESVIVGFDFAFGHRASGNPDTLCELGHGKFAVEVVRPFHINGSKVSSTLIREHLLEGRQKEANRLLGRRYVITGVVVHGDARGRTIGFPTANLEPAAPYVIPRSGVYAIRATVGGEQVDGVMNIGNRPTFTGENRQTLEAHLFDFSRDVYGERLTVEFAAYLRPERKFASVDELVRQIASDAEQARTELGRVR
jgi:riboflavin kinase / FMN adenylyltransferase